MGKPFDTTMKSLLEDCAQDWVQFFAADFDLPSMATMKPLQVELLPDPLMADKVFELLPPADGILHIEPQTSWDTTFAQRLHAYNAALDLKYNRPVYTVALLLRPEASSGLTGQLQRHHQSGRRYLEFNYSVIRVWDLSTEELLQGGIGTLPMVLLTNYARDRLDEFVDRIDERLTKETDPKRRERILLDSMILTGLRYNDLEIERAFRRARGMKESSSYQMIIREGREEGIKIGMQKGIEAGIEKGREEGREEGRISSLKTNLLRILRAKFPPLSAEIEQKVVTETDAVMLEVAVVTAATATRLEDVIL